MRDYNAMFKRLPERYRKPNTYKMYYALFGDRAEYYGTIQGIKDSRNIDIAVGKSLDMLGTNVGQFRDGEDDDLYRQLIKVRIIVNMSIGDITTINTVLNYLVKDVYVGLKEAWPEKNWKYEPSAIAVKMKYFNTDIPFDLIHLIKAAGVKILFETEAEQNIYVGAYGTSGHFIHSYPNEAEDMENEQNIYVAAYNIYNKLNIKSKAAINRYRDKDGDVWYYSQRTKDGDII